VALGDLIDGTVAAATAGGLVSLAWWIYSRWYVPPSAGQALVVPGIRRAPPSGSPAGSRGVAVAEAEIRIGRGAVVPPWRKSVETLPLRLLSVDARVRQPVASGAAATGTEWEVQVGALAKISTDPEALRAAAENLLGQSPDEIRSLARRTIESSILSVLARIPAEEFEHDWDRLAAEVLAAASAELVEFGIVIRSLTVRELALVASSGVPVARDAGHPRLSLSSAEVDMLDRLHRLEVRMDRTETDSASPNAPSSSDGATAPIAASAGPARGIARSRRTASATGRGRSIRPSLTDSMGMDTLSPSGPALSSRPMAASARGEPLPSIQNQ
jgi:hypothetical protein